MIPTQKKKWIVFVVRGATNPNNRIVIEAESGSAAMKKAEEEVYTVYGITDCTDLLLEGELVEKRLTRVKRWINSLFEKV